MLTKLRNKSLSTIFCCLKPDYLKMTQYTLFSKVVQSLYNKNNINNFDIFSFTTMHNLNPVFDYTVKPSVLKPNMR